MQHFAHFKDFFYRDFLFHNIPYPDEMKHWIDLKHLICVSISYILHINLFQCRNKYEKLFIFVQINLNIDFRTYKLVDAFTCIWHKFDW